MASRATTYIVLLRGINVGGNRKVPMADLRTLLEDAGAENVTTYVQSGYAVLTSTASAASLRTTIEGKLQERFGFHVDVMVRSIAELKKVIAANPYGDAASDPTKVHVVFLNDKPKAADVAAIDQAAFAPDELTARGREIYLCLPNGAGRSKLAGVLERKIKVPATARNWRTVTTLLELAEAAGT